MIPEWDNLLSLATKMPLNPKPLYMAMKMPLVVFHIRLQHRKIYQCRYVAYNRHKHGKEKGDATNICCFD